jgi:FKBP-type peptidyl-prolyl cis-trans isomerase
MRLTALLAFIVACAATAANAAGPDYLAANARAAGVTVLPGLQYKVLKSGPADGPTALRSDDVTVRYEGRFPDGKLFDASPEGGTTTFPLQKLIPGWVAALQLMRPGDVWMLYLPPNLAYGAKGKGPIPPGATLVFKVELVGVAPHTDAPAAK